MEHLENTYQLIEAYLSGEMSPEETKAFEARLTNEPALAEEFAIHKDLQSYFENEDLRAFKRNLEKVTSTSSNSSSNSSSRYNKYLWLLIIPILLLGYFLGKQLKNIDKSPREDLNNSRTIDQEPAPKETLQKEIIDTVAEPKLKEEIDLDESVEEEAPPKPVSKEKKREIIKDIIPKTKANLFAEANFEANPALEIMINGGMRSLRKSVTALKTQESILYKEQTDIPFNVQFEIESTRSHVAEDFVIYIYSNKERAYQNVLPLFSLTPQMEKINNGYRLSADTRLAVNPGLYYYILEVKATEDLIYINKFEYR